MPHRHRPDPQALQFAPVEAGAVTTKGIAPTSMGKESGGTPFTITKGKVNGTAQGMGAAKKGGKYTWI
jgi:hypothetical protein